MKRSILLSRTQGCAHCCFTNSLSFLPPSAQAGVEEGASVPVTSACTGLDPLPASHSLQ